MSYISRKRRHLRDTLVLDWNWSIITHGLRKWNRVVNVGIHTHRHTHTYIYIFLSSIYNERLQVLVFKTFFKITVSNSWKSFKERLRNFRLMETTRTGQLCHPVLDPLAIKDVIDLFDNTCMEPLDWNVTNEATSISWFSLLLYDYSINKENVFIWRKFMLKYSGTLPVYSQMAQKKKKLSFTFCFSLKVF